MMTLNDLEDLCLTMEANTNAIRDMDNERDFPKIIRAGLNTWRIAPIIRGAAHSFAAQDPGNEKMVRYTISVRQNLKAHLEVTHLALQDAYREVTTNPMTEDALDPWETESDN